MATEIDIAVTTTTYNVIITAEPNEYIVNITTNAGGSGVDSVTGTTVNNTDPLNPVVNVPNLTQVLSIQDKVYKEITEASYGFIAEDGVKWILNSDGTDLTFDDSANEFLLYSEIRLVNQIDCTITFVDTDMRSNLGVDVNTPITTANLLKGDDISFKKIGSDPVWFLQVNRSGSSAVDSVNGQTGVVVLDAADVGAEPTKGSDDNYVTDAQLVVIGNTSGTNSGDNATNTKYEVTATTGAVISFATRQVYNSIASPSSSNLTDNLSGAQIGVVQKIYHNAGTAPTFPVGWVKRGTGSYVTSTLNIIYAEWSVGTTVEYWITQ